MRRRRIIVDDDYVPSRNDKVCLKADPDRSGGTVVSTGVEQSEVKWDTGVNGGWYPNHYLMLKPQRERRRLRD